MLRWLLFLALFCYGLWLIFAYRYHFIDNVNLVFHEAGHIIFTPFGETMHFLGGTFAQLFFPAAVAAHFWRNDRRSSAAIAGFWFAESLMYTAHYMGDAQARLLPLVGGGIHDWYFLFSKWGVLAQTWVIARCVHLLAAVILVVCCIYLYRQVADSRRIDYAELDQNYKS